MGPRLWSAWNAVCNRIEVESLAVGASFNFARNSRHSKRGDMIQRHVTSATLAVGPSCWDRLLDARTVCKQARPQADQP